MRPGFKLESNATGEATPKGEGTAVVPPCVWVNTQTSKPKEGTAVRQGVAWLALH